MPDERADWQLPPGVSRGTWDYATSPRIASEYDAFHAGHRLLTFDQQLVDSEIAALAAGRQLTIVDLGCGTGRSVQGLLTSGHRVIGIDLSEAMLRAAEQKAIALGPAAAANAAWLRGNMAQLDFLADHCVDAAICLYSSFGMLRGSEHRLRCLEHVCRCLRSGGLLILHVHNRGNWWLTSSGRSLIRQAWSNAFLRRASGEPGDRYYAYRGLPQMYLHIFTGRELAKLMRRAGFHIRTWIPLDQSSGGKLPHSRVFPHFRAGGYLVIGEPRIASRS